MAGSPRYKVYDAKKVYQAATKEAEAAAALVAFYGDGATIRLDHGAVLWTEGKEAIPANESFDTVAETVYARQGANARASYAKYHADHAARFAPAKEGV